MYLALATSSIKINELICILGMLYGQENNNFYSNDIYAIRTVIFIHTRAYKLFLTVRTQANDSEVIKILYLACYDSLVYDFFHVFSI